MLERRSERSRKNPSIILVKCGLPLFIKTTYYGCGISIRNPKVI
jgi:hypothetical protein